MVTIYTLCYNEEFMLPFFISHYRGLFPDCHIVVYDNMSTDSSKQIALDAGCEVRGYDTGGKLDDKVYLQIKNNCWKDAKTDWVMVVDCDELLYIDYNYDLKHLDKLGVTVIESEGWNMVNMENNMNLSGITHGVRAPSYDKTYLFKRSEITEINYGLGAHSCNIQGRIKKSVLKYRCRHYKYINPDYMARRHAAFAKRLSAENIKYGYGEHYTYTEAHIRAEFEQARKQAIKIL